MKKNKIYIEVDQEKFAAVVTCLEDKNTTVEAELEDAFHKLYDKHVPAQVKVFLEKHAEIRNSQTNKSKKKKQSQQNTLSE